MIYTWIIFYVRWHYSRKFFKQERGSYHPYCDEPVTVIIPVLNEKPLLFMNCLQSVSSQLRKQDELFVVFDHFDMSKECRDIAARYATEVITCSRAGKRPALVEGMLKAKGSIFVLMDSDSVISPHTFQRVINRFSDSSIGGVCSNQRILHPYGTWRAICDLIERVRFTYGSIPMTSYYRTVGCLPGRMIAVRKAPIMHHLDEFLNERFFGKLVTTSDDRWLTGIILQEGYGTIMASDTCAKTDCPSTFRGVWRQQLRWNRGSQRRTLSDLHWLPRFKATFFCFITDILTPLWVLLVFLSIILHYLTGMDAMFVPVALLYMLLMAFGGVLLTIGIKYYKVVDRSNVKYFPLFCLFFCFVLPVISLWGLITITNSNWLTRGSKQ